MNIRIKLALGVAAAAAAAVGGTVAFAGGDKPQRAWLHGYEEVPAVSTAANGRFEATLTPTRDGLAYTLSYAGLEGSVSQAHIHFGQRNVNGGISAWLCGTTTNTPPTPGPTGTQTCPQSGTITGTITAANVVGPTGQGIAAGELEELLHAIKAGLTYANVHSTKFPGGEIRGQLRRGWPGKGHGR